MHRPNWRLIAQVSILVTTVPALALLCRGHTPSRYATANLPFWERQVPQPATLAVQFSTPPLQPTAIALRQSAPLQSLLSTDENALLTEVENPSHSHLSVGKVGGWLAAASALPSNDVRLTTKRDRVAIRLLGAQDADGNLAPMPVVTTGKEQTTPHVLNLAFEAQAKDLNGLMAYYERTHSPAAIYAAMHAGEALLSHDAIYSSDISAETAGQMVLPITRLYLATGERRYLQFAKQQAQTGTQMGLGLCSLYEVTGDKGYLTSAEKQWDQTYHQHKSSAPEFTAELLKLTSDPIYATALQTALRRSVWPTSVAYTHIQNGISVNTPIMATAKFGNAHLSQTVTPDKTRTTLNIVTSQPRLWTLRVFIPGPSQPKSRTVSMQTPQVVLNGIIQHAPIQANHYLKITRWWRSGDTLVIKNTLTKPAPPTRL